MLFNVQLEVVAEIDDAVGTCMETRLLKHRITSMYKSTVSDQ
jgi:hypothetical protein